MEVVILGSGTAIPHPRRASPGIAIQAAGVLLLLDPGAGSLSRAARLGLEVHKLDAVLLTHLHPDHTGDLVPLLFALRNPEWLRDTDLLITGPEGLTGFLRRLEAAYGSWIEPEGYRRELRVLRSGALSIGPVEIRTCPVRHGPPAIAYEIIGPGPRRVVYSGDTDYCEEIAELGAGADLLILECSFPEGETRPGHLTPSLAGRIAGRARCRKLVLTHFYPACEGEDLVGPCQEFYNGPLVLAEDGLRVSL